MAYEDPPLTPSERQGFLEVDADEPEKVRVEATVDATQVYTGQPQRDAHLRSAVFFDVEHHPTWTFVGSRIHQVSGTEFEVTCSDGVLVGRKTQSRFSARSSVARRVRAVRPWLSALQRRLDRNRA